MPRDVAKTVEAAWRIESGRIVGAVARVVLDVGLAEDLAQDAVVSAMEYWSRHGVTGHPAAAHARQWRRPIVPARPKVTIH